ncbi:MAG: helix-turn-helix domain-containing protein, partial [Kangiellaceae bacterium]|nr:helix-turn-helix domain-containing protein [Kangiellaceae bacterium]
MSLSEKTISRYCHSYCLDSPGNIIRTCRIEQAKNCLKNNFSVEETVEPAGYKSVFTLRVAFKKVEGISIGKYAKLFASRDTKLKEESREKLEDTLNQNFKNADFNISLFANTLGISERTLHRKFVDLFDITPMQ